MLNALNIFKISIYSDEKDSADASSPSVKSVSMNGSGQELQVIDLVANFGTSDFPVHKEIIHMLAQHDRAIAVKCALV